MNTEHVGLPVSEQTPAHRVLDAALRRMREVRPDLALDEIERLAAADPRALLVTAIIAALDPSPFLSPRMLPHAVVVLREDEMRVTSRGDFAAWLRANDLPAAARECMKRTVAPGHVLVWLEVDIERFGHAGFRVVPLRQGVEMLRRELVAAECERTGKKDGHG